LGGNCRGHCVCPIAAVGRVVGVRIRGSSGGSDAHADSADGTHK